MHRVFTSVFLITGQMILLENGRNMLLMCSPHVATVEELLEKHLHFSDMPLYDATRGLILLNMTRMSQVDLKSVPNTSVRETEFCPDLLTDVSFCLQTEKTGVPIHLFSNNEPAHLCINK